jgi:hypothetical protein
MATSSAQNDSGLFEVNFRDERYLPFEGCGAFGEWQIELQENENLRVFDYNTVSDVILGLKYTARDGGGDAADTATFKGKAVKYLTDTLKATVPPADDLDAPATLKTGLALWRMFSLRHEFPSEWHKMFHPIGGGTQQMDFSIQKERFPFFVQERTVRIKKVHVYGFFSTNDDYTAAITSHGATVNISLLESTQHKGSNTGSLPSVFALGDFTLTLKKGLVDAPESEIKDLILVLEYELPS